MNGIVRMIIISFLLLIMAVLAYSQAPIQLNGSAGIAMLKSLTNTPTNNLNNTSLNATNSSANLSAPRNSNDFDSWGTEPKPLPLPGSQTDDDFLNDSWLSSV